METKRAPVPGWEPQLWPDWEVRARRTSASRRAPDHGEQGAGWPQLPLRPAVRPPQCATLPGRPGGRERWPGLAATRGLAVRGPLGPSQQSPRRGAPLPHRGPLVGPVSPIQAPRVRHVGASRPPAAAQGGRRPHPVWGQGQRTGRSRVSAGPEGGPGPSCAPPAAAPQQRHTRAPPNAASPMGAASGDGVHAVHCSRSTPTHPHRVHGPQATGRRPLSVLETWEPRAQPAAVAEPGPGRAHRESRPHRPDRCSVPCAKGAINIFQHRQNTINSQCEISRTASSLGQRGQSGRATRRHPGEGDQAPLLLR